MVEPPAGAAGALGKVVLYGTPAEEQQVRPCLCLVHSTAFAAKTPPLSYVSTAFVAKKSAVPCVCTTLVPKTLTSWQRHYLCLVFCASTAFAAPGGAFLLCASTAFAASGSAILLCPTGRKDRAAQPPCVRRHRRCNDGPPLRPSLSPPPNLLSRSSAPRTSPTTPLSALCEMRSVRAEIFLCRRASGAQ